MSRLLTHLPRPSTPLLPHLIHLNLSFSPQTYAAAATILRGADSSCVDSSTSIGKQILEYPQSTSPPAATPSGLSAESEGGGDIPASETILKDESTVNNSTASAVANASEVVVQDV